MKLYSSGPIVAIVCVMMISAGQLLFRQTSLAIERRGGDLSARREDAQRLSLIHISEPTRPY